jgi:hypothetical protein
MRLSASMDFSEEATVASEGVTVLVELDWRLEEDPHLKGVVLGCQAVDHREGLGCY